MKSANIRIVQGESDDEMAPIDSMEVPLNDATGPRYRKISLNGRPLADEAPEGEGESDLEKEESYVDAFDLSFVHNTSDVHIPIPGSDLSLEVSRTVRSEVWGSHSGLRPHERADLPFGAGWTSNLTSYIERSVSTGPVSDGIFEPVEVRVVDHQGRGYKFVEHNELGKRIYTPMPTSRIEARFHLTSLEYDNTVFPAVYLFRTNHGTTLRFEEIYDGTASVSNDRVNGSSSSKVTAYSRLIRVTDRLGYSLHYDYNGTHALIPKKIFASFPVHDANGNIDPNGFTPMPNQAIYIRQDNYRVTKVWDPRGTLINYTYEEDTFSHPFLPALSQRVPLLVSVNRPGFAPVNYSYEGGGGGAARRLVEIDPVPRKRASDVRNYFHVNLSAITQVIEGNQTVSTSIARVWDNTRFQYIQNEVSSGYVRQSALPRPVSSITGPWGSSTFQTIGTSRLGGGAAAGSPGSRLQHFEGTRATLVTDAAGSSTKYRFEDILMETLWFYKDFVDSSNAYKNPRLLYYLKMVLELPEGGREEFNFDLDAGLSLASVVDFSGNRTTYTYGDAWSPPAGSLFNRNAHTVDLGDGRSLNVGKDYGMPGFYKHGEPTQVVSAGNRKTTYSYGIFRLLDATDSYLGTNKKQTTAYQLNPVNGRTEAVYVSGSDGTGTTTTLSYGFPSMPGFVTRKTVAGSAAEGGLSIISDCVPDSLGRIKLSVSYPDNAPAVGPSVDAGSWNPAAGSSWVENTYDYNNNKIFMERSAGVADSQSFQSEIYPGLTSSKQLLEYSLANQLVKVTYDNDNSKEFRYDLRGNKIEEIDERGRSSYMDFDLAGRFYRSRRPLENGDVIATSHVLNGVGSILATTDPRGIITGFGYDRLHRLVTKNSPGEGLTTFTYGRNCGGSVFSHANFKPTLSTDPRGFKTFVEYDAQYRAVTSSIEYEPGRYGVSRTLYDWAGNPVEATDPSGITTTTTFDALSRPTHVMVEGRTDAGNGNGQAIETATYYTATGLPWKVVTSAGSDVADRVELHYHDGMGRVKETVTPLVHTGYDINTSPSVKTLYDLAGNIAETVVRVNTSGSTYVSSFAYDSLGRRTHTRSPDVYDAKLSVNVSPVTRVEYDAVGNVLRSWDAYNSQTTNEYDWANRVVSTTLPAVEVLNDGFGGNPANAAPKSEMEYDLGGNVLASTDALGNTVTNVWDAASRLTSTTDAESITVRNGYDPAGNLTSLIDGRGKQTLMRYDGLNRLISQQDHLGRSRTFFYNSVDLLKRTDELGRVTDYRYDSHGRLWKTIYRTGDGGFSERVNEYDGLGQLKTVNEEGTAADVAYSYDGLGRTISETSNGVAHQYEYDFIGNATKVTYGHTGRVIESEYDSHNRLSLMEDGATFTRYSYDANGNKVKTEFGNTAAGAAHTTQQWTHDALNRVRTAVSSAGGTAVSGSSTYWDSVGNLRRTVESYANIDDRIVNLGYDNLYRLTAEVVKNSTGTTTLSSTVFDHDDASNVILRSVTEGAAPAYDRSFTYNSLNQLVTYDDADPALAVPVTLEYDLAGNRIARVREGKRTSYRYDFENRLIAVNDAGASGMEGSISLTPGTEAPAPGTAATEIRFHLGATDVYEYTYDYRSRRVMRVEPDLTTSLVFSGGVSVQEFASDTIQPGVAPEVEFIRGSSVGGGIGGLLYSERDGALRWNHYNGRGDVVGQTGSSGAIEYQAAYLAYGDRTEELGASDNRQRANTKDEDPTGLLNEGMRYRDIASGVFLTRDPAGFVDGPNLYAYVRQNPWTFFDPLGLEKVTVSGQPGDHAGRRHFLVNGLDRATKMKEKITEEKSKEEATWLVYNEGGKGGYKPEDLAEFKTRAEEAGVNMKVVQSAKDIVTYVNEKTGKENARTNDKITSFSYIGHATPGNLDVGFIDKSTRNLMTSAVIRPSSFKSKAFASGCDVNLVGGCRTANPSWLRSSAMDQFAKIVDSNSTVKGAKGRVNFGTKYIDTDMQLVEGNKVPGDERAEIIERNGYSNIPPPVPPYTIPLGY